VDLRLYFQKIRTIEASIPGLHAAVISLETSDGGRAGQVSEVSRAVAAKLVAQGKVRLADEQEAEDFKSFTREAGKLAEEGLAPENIPSITLQDADLELLRGLLRREQ
jgi:hypothetical protein